MVRSPSYVVTTNWGHSVITMQIYRVPDDPVTIDASQLAISEGDHIHVLLNTTNGGLQGSTTLINLNTSQTFSYSQDAPVSWRGPTWPSPGTSAEWIIEAGTYLNATRFVFPDWGNASVLDARACYNTTGACGKCLCNLPKIRADHPTTPVLPGQGTSSSSTQTTAVLLNDTDILYTRSYVDGSDIWIAYVEEPSPA